MEVNIENLMKYYKDETIQCAKCYVEMYQQFADYLNMWPKDQSWWPKEIIEQFKEVDI